MIIREATAEDIAQLTTFKKPQSEQAVKHSRETQLTRLEDIKKGNALYLVAEDENQIIAHVFINLQGSATEPGYPNMIDLYVMEEKRNRGTGSALVREAERIVKE